jgi:hypothetical protein
MWPGVRRAGLRRLSGAADAGPGGAQRRRLINPDAGRVLFGKYARDWIEERPGLRPKTVQLYRYLLRRHFRSVARCRPVSPYRASSCTNRPGVSLCFARRLPPVAPRLAPRNLVIFANVRMSENSVDHALLQDAVLRETGHAADPAQSSNLARWSPHREPPCRVTEGDQDPGHDNGANRRDGRPSSGNSPGWSPRISGSSGRWW